MVRQGSIFLILICLARQGSGQQSYRGPTVDPVLLGSVPSGPKVEPDTGDMNKMKEMLLVSAADIIHGTNTMIYKTGEIREASDQCASFEIGFVFRTLEEAYRKMLDLYNTTVNIRTKNSNMGQMTYLEKVEQLHWKVYHYHNMLHEIERKYKMDSIINGSGMFEDGERWTRTTTADKPRKTWTYTWKKQTNSWWYPLAYGWNKNYYDDWK